MHFLIFLNRTLAHFSTRVLVMAKNARWLANGSDSISLDPKWAHAGQRWAMLGSRLMLGEIWGGGGYGQMFWGKSYNCLQHSIYTWCYQLCQFVTFIILFLLPSIVDLVNFFFDKTISLPILNQFFFSFWEKGNLLFVTLIVCAVMFTQLLIFDVKCRDCLYLGICCFARQLFHTMIHVVLSIMHYVFTLSWGICLRETYKRSHVFQLVLCVFHSFFSSLI